MTAVIIALGANLPSGRFGEPLAGLEAVCRLLPTRGIALRSCSRWYHSPPWPPSGQPWYVNGAVLAETLLSAEALLAALHALEAETGRRRQHPNQARPMDLDLIDHGGRVTTGADWPRLPHPRLQDRAFVLQPMVDLLPDWRDPRSGRHLASLLAELPPGSLCQPFVKPTRSRS